MTWGEFAALGAGGCTSARRTAGVWAAALVLGAVALGVLWLSDGQAQRASVPTPAQELKRLRVVSLSPAITQWIALLGHADALVGVGDGDELAPRGTPSVGTFMDVDLERLAGLRPTWVGAATARDKLPASLRTAAARGGFTLDAWPFPTTLKDAQALGRHVGAALGDVDRGAAAATRLQARLDAVAQAVSDRPRVRTLLLFSIEPLQACGVGTVHDGLLAVAGGVNVLEPSAGSAPTLDRELLRGLAPDVILVMRPGAAPQKAQRDPRFVAFAGLGLPAVDTQRVILLNDPAVLVSGPTVDTTAVSFAVALHPERAIEVARAYAAASEGPVDLEPVGRR